MAYTARFYMCDEHQIPYFNNEIESYWEFARKYMEQIMVINLIPRKGDTLFFPEDDAPGERFRLFDCWLNSNHFIVDDVHHVFSNLELSNDKSVITESSCELDIYLKSGSRNEFKSYNCSEEIKKNINPYEYFAKLKRYAKLITHD